MRSEQHSVPKNVIQEVTSNNMKMLNVGNYCTIYHEVTVLLGAGQKWVGFRFRVWISEADGDFHFGAKQMQKETTVINAPDVTGSLQNQRLALSLIAQK